MILKKKKYFFTLLQTITKKHKDKNKEGKHWKK